MLTAESNGDPVRSKTSVASARPAIVLAPMLAENTRNSARNSATVNSSR